MDFEAFQPRHRGVGWTLLVMFLLGAAALYWPDSWVGRYIGILMFVCGVNALMVLDMTLSARCDDITRLSIQVANLSREVKEMYRGAENMHDRLWKIEHGDPFADV